MSSIFEALADPTRRRILALLLSSEQPVGDLVDALGVAQPSVSKHLARLKAAGLVDLRAEAQRRVYWLTPQPLLELGGWLFPYLEAQKAERPLDMAERRAEPTPKTRTVDGSVDLTLREVGPQGWTLGFEAHLGAPVDTVWAGLTTPELLTTWLGKATLDPQVGGRFRFQFAGAATVMGGKVLAWDRGRTLECRWRMNPKKEGPVTRVRFELSSEEDGARLRLTQIGLPAAVVVEFAALWRAHLERLEPALCGEAAAWAPSRLEMLRAEYAQAFGINA